MSDPGVATAAAPPVGPQPSVFVVFAEQDSAWVRGVLLAGLADAGIPTRTEDDFAGNRPWIQQVERAIVESSQIVLVVSGAFLESPALEWIRVLAQHFGQVRETWPVLPVKLERLDLPPGLGALVGLDAFDDERQDVVERLCRALVPGGLPPPPPAPSPPCPFPGMTAYGPEQTDLFFGRADEIAEVVDRLRRRGCVALVGPSGSGKSSLLAAGVVPDLRRRGWTVVVTRPGRRPLEALEAATSRFGSEMAEHRLLVVDQLEEVFASATAADAAAFNEKLVGQLYRCSVAIGLRADFYGQVMTSPLWPIVRDHRFDVLPLDGDQLESAVIEACATVGVYVEPALVDRLRYDAADEPGSLPLLQEALVLLWERLERRYLPLRAYDALVLPEKAYGREPRTGLQVALARHADAVITRLPEAERLVARRVFTQLVQFGLGRQDVRRQRTLAELREGDDDPDAVERVVRHLADARLLTLGRGAGPDGEAVVDLAHEAIITSWPELTSWLREHRAAEHQRRWLEERSAEWIDGGRKGGLLDEVQLTQAEEWLQGPDPAQVGAGPAIRAFAGASREQVDADHRRAQASARRLRMLAVMLAGLLAASVVAGGMAVLQARRAADARVEAHAVGLAQAAASRPPAEVDAGLLVGVAGLQLEREARTEGGLLAALTTNPRVRRVIDLGTPVVASASARDGAFVAVAPQSAWIALVESSTGRATRFLDTLADGEPRSVTVAPDGTKVAVGTSEGEVLLWRLDADDPSPEQLPQRSESVRAVAFSPDGEVVAAGDSSGGVSLLPVEGGDARLLDGHESWVNALTFSADGRRLLSGSGVPGVDGDTRVLVHDLEAGTSRTFDGHDSSVRSIEIGPDGSTVASSDQGGTVHVWDLSSGRLSGTLEAHQGAAYDVGFVDRGAGLVTAGRDHTVRFWDLADLRPRGEPLVGHALAVRAAVPTADDTLVSAGTDGRVIVWDLASQPYPQLTTALLDQPAEVTAVAATTDGDLVATGSVDGRVVVRDGESGSPAGPEIEVGSRVQALAFTADRTGLVSADRGGRLALWSTTDGRLLAQRTLFPDPRSEWLLAVAAGPDGTVATGDTTGAVRLWRWDRDLVADPRSEPGAHRSWVTGLGFAGPDRLVSVGADGGAFSWDMTGSPMGRTQLMPARGQLTAVGTADGGRIAVIGDADDRVLTAPTAQTSRRAPAVFAHSADVVAVAVAGDRVATGDRDGVLALWGVEADHLVPVGRPLELGRPILSAAFGAGGRTLVTGGPGGPMLFDVDPRSWREIACMIAGRDLTAEERSPYAPDLDDVPVCPEGTP